jgi:hypothetical protein
MSKLRSLLLITLDHAHCVGITFERHSNDSASTLPGSPAAHAHVHARGAISASHFEFSFIATW